MKRSIILLLALIAIFESRAQVYYKSGTFDVVQPVKTIQYPGVMGAPINTTVSFMLVLKKCTRIQLDSFWLDGFSDVVRISYKNGEAWDGKPLKGDTLMVSLTYYKMTSQDGYPKNETGMSGSPENKAPLAHKGQALFRYSMDGKKYYFSIKKIAQGTNIYAP